MSLLLETLGRGLLANVRGVFSRQFPECAEDNLNELRSRLANSPGSFELSMRLALVCLREMRLAEARRLFQESLTHASTPLQPLLGLACVADEMGDLDRALQHLLNAQTYDPEDPAIAFALGYCEERLDHADAARQYYRNAMTLCPHLRNVHERLAALAIRDGDLREAVCCYERVIALDPGDLDALLTLGALQLQMGQPHAALEPFQRALLIDPDSDDESLARADRLIAEGRMQEALRALEQLIEQYPGVAAFRVHLGDLFVKLGDDERSIANYRAAIEAQPGFLEATVKLGTQHLRGGRFLDAARTFNRAVELNDRLIMGFVGLGIAQLQSGRTPEAEATLDLAASLEPSSTLLFSETTRLHLKAERQNTRPRPSLLTIASGETFDEGVTGDGLIEEVLRRHQQAILNTPNVADLHYRHGLLLRQLGRTYEAIAAFRNAVAINRHYSKALAKLGLALRETGDRDDAIQFLGRSLTFGPDSIETHYQLGLLFAQRSRFDLTVEQFELNAGSDGELLRANLALALQTIGMVDRASATWRALCDLVRSVPQSADRERAARTPDGN